MHEVRAAAKVSAVPGTWGAVNTLRCGTLAPWTPPPAHAHAPLHTLAGFLVALLWVIGSATAWWVYVCRALYISLGTASVAPPPSFTCGPRPLSRPMLSRAIPPAAAGAQLDALAARAPCWLPRKAFVEPAWEMTAAVYTNTDVLHRLRIRGGRHRWSSHREDCLCCINPRCVRVLVQLT